MTTAPAAPLRHAIDPGRGTSGLPSLSVIVLTMLALALPILLTPIPLLIDLPSHIARFHVEETIAHNPALAANFTYQWRFIPNLGIDLIVAPLAGLIGVENAARIAVATIPALGGLGMLLIGAALHGRLTAGALLALTLNYAYPLTFGFVNACLAVSLALVVFGLWLHFGNMGRVRARLVLAAVSAPVILTAHIIGFGVLGLLAGGAAMAERREDWRHPVRFTIGVVRPMLPFAWPLAFLLLWQTGEAPPSSEWFAWAQIARWLVGVLRDRWMPIDIASALLLYAAVALAVALAIIGRPRFVIEWRGAVPAAILWMAVILLPGRMFGSEFASVRLIPVALSISLLAVRERRGDARTLMAVALGFLGLRLALTTASLATASAQAERELAVLPMIPSGARVAAMSIVPCAREWAPPRLSHIQSYATTRRDAFANGQFSAVAGQAMGLTSRIDPVLAELLSTGTVERCDRFFPSTPLHETLAGLPWRGVDYLWLIDAGDTAVPLPAGARLVWRSDRSRLYEIRPPR
ncbi:hypothetical protein [Sphingomonas phyllosphaerae]|uniref:hypothetical protein n=1 Tax=Sphingomonas phyllosphaerae TaxID=257003 RepID=UPI000428CA0C|nr:hypothetical protein [Sphingomonas phyllosphaerae]